MENVKDTKEAKTRVVLINQIIDRAALNEAIEMLKNCI